MAVTVGRKGDISEVGLWPTGGAGGWLVKESRVSLWLPARMTMWMVTPFTGARTQPMRQIWWGDADIFRTQRA